jgi:anti-anti-sigma factor
MCQPEAELQFSQDICRKTTKMTATLERCSVIGANPRDARLPRQAPLVVANIPHNDSTILVKVEGQAGVVGLQELQFSFVQIIARRTRVAVLDLSGLTFISSLAMGLVVGLRRDLARWNGCVMIAGCPSIIVEAFDVAGLTELFTFHASAEAALAAC